MWNRKKKVRMLKDFAKIIHPQKINHNQTVGGVILVIIFLGCNCAGFTEEEIKPLIDAIEDWLKDFQRP